LQQVNPKYFMEKMHTMIKEETKDWIKFLPFRDVVLWDVKRYASEKIKSDFPIVKLGLHIQEQSQKVKLFDYPEDEFGILGVNNKIGIFDAYKEKGANINQSYKRMEKGWLAYNPYRVNVGSIGMRTGQHEHEFISPAYVVFSCKETLLPDFLYKLFKTDRFNKIINESTTGSVRQNLTIDVLKTLDIALPPIEIQQTLLDEYYLKSKKAVEQDIIALEKEKEINLYLLDRLGVSLEKTIKKKGITFTKFSMIDRWAADYLFNLSSIKGITNAKYPAIKVRNLILSYQYGLSSKATEDPVGIPMLRMNNINNSELDIEDLKYITIENELKEKNLLEKGDILFNRTNSKELVGKTAVFELDGEYTFASYLIRLKLDTDKANVHYINYLFNSPIGRVQIDMISRQVLGQANVNAQELQDFIFPVPDLKTQNLIVDDVYKIKEEANALKLNAELNRKEAIKEFEQTIFKK
jgi:type I restriction enzyme S subunit